MTTKTPTHADAGAAKHTDLALTAAIVILAPYPLIYPKQHEHAAAVIDEAFPAHAELLEACHAFCRAMCEEKADLDAEKNAIRHAYDLARAAIAKAESGQ